ncbi:MAG: hypothetical protein PVF63_05335 [Gammaproteobacteria bacterium]|jgi:hypothetical protein
MHSAPVDKPQERHWGQPPVALAPAALRTVAGDKVVPKFLGELAGEELRLRALDTRFWQRDVKLEKSDLDKLLKWLGGMLRDHRDADIAEAGFPPIPLVALCLPQATQKAFEKALGKTPLQCEEMTIGSLLDLPNIGPKRTLELLCALDDVIDDAYRKPPPSLARGDVRERRKKHRTPREITTFFRVLGAWASGERGEKDFRNALPKPHPGWPPELAQLWKRVQYCSTNELAGSLVQRYGIPRLIEYAFRNCDHRHRLILRARVFTTDSPTSLESLASVLDCTPEDVNRLQREGLHVLEKLRTDGFRAVAVRAKSVRGHLGLAIPRDDALIDQALEWAFPDFGDRDTVDFGRSLMFWLAGPYRKQNGWYVASADLAIRSTHALLRLCDEDGIIGRDGVQQVLARLGIHARYRDQWVRRLGEFAQVESGLVPLHAVETEVLPQIRQ